MICKNCGEEIPDGSKKCKYCKQLVEQKKQLSSMESNEKKTKRKTGTEVTEILKGTIPEGSIQKPQTQEEECPTCHKPLEDGECSRCGYKKEDKKEESKPEKEMKKIGSETIRWDHVTEIEKGCFVLNPLSAKTGKAEGDPIPFNGSEVELTRENTAPDNKTITSKVQALMTFANGEWSITDKSELKSTFVQASRPITLKDGDLIFLGSQLYEFRVQE